MEELFGMHKDIPFGWVLWLPMIALWVQAALSARGLSRRDREQPKAPRSASPPRLIAPR